MPDDTPQKLFLLDGMALVYRAHFALIRSPIFTSKGVNTSAIFGFANTLVELLEKQKPSHLAVVFDTSAPTERHKIFPEYKAQRDAMPEDLSKAIPGVKRLVKAFDLPVLEWDGYEADDIIGTLAHRVEKEASGCEVFMVTPDKDFAQLVSDVVSIYKPGRQGGDAEIIGIAEVKEKWGVERAEQVIDILGLWGDASDNIPGFPGVGEKTAKKLIGQFGSIEELLKNTDQLKGKQKENVENFGEQAQLSKRLATILLDAPVELDWGSLKVGEPDREALASLFVEFEFNALGKRLLGNDFVAGRGFASTEKTGEGGAAELKKLGDAPYKYTLIKTGDAKGRAALVEKLGEQQRFCFDTETTGRDPMRCELLGMAFSWKEGEAYYVALPSGAQREKALGEFAGVLGDASIEKIGHNLKFDLTVLRWAGIEVGGTLFDTMLAHVLVEPDQKHTMDFLAESLLGYSPIPISSIIGDGEEPDGQLSLLGGSMEGADIDKVAEYAAEDADVTFQLAAKLRPALEEKGQQKVFYEIECPLVPVLVAMEHEGVALDLTVLDEIRVALENQIVAREKEIHAAAGADFNLNSPKQLGEILFDKLKLADKPKKTRTGQYKTDEQVLAGLAPKHPIVAAILEYRESTKLKSTYVDALPGSISGRSGRIHTTFHQLMTATGRLASNNPNLQNIPVRTEQGREIRKAFVPRGPEFCILSADYSQIELRVMAEISGDEGMRQAFRDGLDIHAASAAKVYGVELDEVDADMRRGAKTVNFGIIYGISAFGLSQRLAISRREAADIITAYFEQYPGIKEYMDSTIEFAKENGYVETISGRRRYLRDINSSSHVVRSAAERTAINTPIQGTAADMIKVAMAKVDAALCERELRTKMILQVHDELVFDLHREEMETVKPLVVECMGKALPMEVPVVVDCGVGENWLEAH